MIQLSARLSAIAEYVPEGSRVADIGSDHALLPSFLAERGIAISAVAGELNEGPYRAAVKQIMTSGLQGIVEARRGNGLEVVKPGEVDVVTIAGMGGSLIRSILDEGRERLEGVRRLILQPNVGEEFVRRWLRDRDWALLGETILEEDGKIYEILIAERMDDADAQAALYEPRTGRCGLVLSTDRLLRVGPYLVAEGSPAFVGKWESELRKLDRICRELEGSEREDAQERLERFKAEIAETEGMLKCLQTDTRSFSKWRNMRLNLTPCRTIGSGFKSER